MAGLPSHIFIIRHGNRLDAADKRWHLTSPTPYDPPLTYGGLLQARQVGCQINAILEQAKLDGEKASSRNGAPRRKRFRVVIHSSPFLRCVQTSIGISSGLAQVSPDSNLKPSDLIVPVEATPGKPETEYKTAVLRLDPFLGEWQSPEYFENITPPPASSLMIGSAKAELLRCEDYSMYVEKPLQVETPRKSSLWSGSSSRSGSPVPDNGSSFGTSNLASALDGAKNEKTGYVPPRPTYAVSSAGKIPDGIVTHARDECLTVDYQWDSTRSPVDFGDGGTLPEDWTAMHKRFRRGIKKMLHWYANSEAPAKQVSVCPSSKPKSIYATEDEDVETVIIMVSHGAGCNALIGAITYQPVLMDVGIASITLGARKEGLNYKELYEKAEARDTSGTPLVHVDHMYDIRISATTEHLRSSSSTPVSARSSSTSVWNGTGSRGRISSISTSTQPNQNSISYHDAVATSGGQSLGRANSTSRRTGGFSAMASTGLFSGPGNNSGNTGAPAPPAQSGLWRPTPAPSSLRLMDDGTGDDEKENDGFPNFDQSRLSRSYAKEDPPDSSVELVDEEDDAVLNRVPTGPLLAAPIKIKTNWGEKDTQSGRKGPKEVTITHELEDDGMWGQPLPAGEAELLRDMTQAKRRWTVTEKSR